MPVLTDPTSLLSIWLYLSNSRPQQVKNKFSEDCAVFKCSNEALPDFSCIINPSARCFLTLS